jgi:lipid-A-disaccharide synthase
MVPPNARNKQAPVVFISAAEPSGDLHGASLIEAVRRRRPATRFVGLAGPRMQRAGCEVLYDLTRNSAMLLGVVGKLREGVELLCRVDRYLAEHRLDAAVMIDSPTLNLPFAHRAKARRLPVFYYVAPQVWAWAEYRVGKIRRRVDRLATILPFEEAFFRGHDIPAVYVGHPLFDSDAVREPDPRRVADLRQRGDPVVAILPGSRSHVIDEVLPGQLEVAAAVRRSFPRAAVLISAAHHEARSTIDAVLAGSAIQPAAIGEDTPEIIAAADLVLVASGTATLVVAAYRKPMIVMYNASQWGYRLIGRHLITTPHLSLVNILAGRELVPEFMPYYTSTRPITDAALAILRSEERKQELTRQLDELITPIAKPGAADNAAAELLDLIDSRNEHRPVPAGSTHAIW